MRSRLLLLALALAWQLPGCDTSPVIHSTTALADTDDRLGPYAVLTEVSDPDGIDRVLLVLQPGELAPVELEMHEVSSGIFRGEIPGQPPFTLVRYYVAVEDGGSRVTDPPDADTNSDARFSFRVLSSPCTSELSCGPGEQCDSSGVCRQAPGPCTTDADCGKGRSCGADGGCRLSARPCVLDEGCLAGEVCDLVLGQCIPRPVCGMDGAGGCPDDFACDLQLGLCRRSCMGDADCGPGESCTAGATASVCSGAKTCSQESECGEALTCDPAGYCRPAGAAPCAPCAQDADCGGASDHCLLLADGLFCGADCSGAPCPQGYTCDSQLSVPQCVPQGGSCPAGG